MTRPHLIAVPVAVLGIALAAPQATTGADAPATSSGSTYVLVHGAWGGGWAFKEVERLLEARGHTVYRPTLTGHGERVHLADPSIDLETHVTDVANLLEWEQLEDVVLVGHSYGGMVVTGVADRVPEGIRRLVYIDAIVPEDGESVNAAFGREVLPGEDEGDGFSHPAWVKEGQAVPHDVPHSLRAFNQPLELSGEASDLPTTYLYLVDPGRDIEEDSFYRFYERAQERGWKVVVKEGWDHNPQWSRPAELAELLHAEAAQE